MMNQQPKVMKAVQLTGHGGLDKLVLRQDIPVPVPGPRDVLIKVGAAGVNNTDLNTRMGWYSKSNGSSSDASWTRQRHSISPDSGGGRVWRSRGHWQ